MTRLSTRHSAVSIAEPATHSEYNFSRDQELGTVPVSSWLPDRSLRHSLSSQKDESQRGGQVGKLDEQ